MVAERRRGADERRVVADGAASSSSDDWATISEQGTAAREREAAVVARWTRITRVAWRVRRLQRIFGYLGNSLKESFGPGIRARLRLVYP